MPLIDSGIFCTYFVDQTVLFECDFRSFKSDKQQSISIFPLYLFVFSEFLNIQL